MTHERHAICVLHPRAPTPGSISVPEAFDADSVGIAAPVLDMAGAMSPLEEPIQNFLNEAREKQS